MNKRLNYVDMVKGFATLIVVVYHLIAPGLLQNLATRLIDAALIIFFFYSGYFYRPGKRTYLENLKTRASSLLGPFFRYSTIFWIIGSAYLLLTDGETLIDALCCLRNFHAGCIWNRVIQGWFGWEYHSLGKRYYYLADFWFLQSMFIAGIVFFFLADRVLEDVKKVITAIVSLLVLTGLCLTFGISLPFNIQIVPFWAAIMLAGAYFGKVKIHEKIKSKGFLKWLLYALVLLCGIAVSCWKEPSTNIFRGTFGEQEVLSMILCIGSSSLLIFGLSGLCRTYEEAGYRTDEIAWLGSHSLNIYLCHVFFAWLISVFTGFSIMNYGDSSTVAEKLFSVLLFVADMALCIGVEIFEQKLKEKKE